MGAAFLPPLLRLRSKALGWGGSSSSTPPGGCRWVSISPKGTGLLGEPLDGCGGRQPWGDRIYNQPPGFFPQPAKTYEVLHAWSCAHTCKTQQADGLCCHSSSLCKSSAGVHISVSWTGILEVGGEGGGDLFPSCFNLNGIRALQGHSTDGEGRPAV